MGNNATLEERKASAGSVKWTLVLYDLLIFSFVSALLFLLSSSSRDGHTVRQIITFCIMSFIVTFVCRIILDIYRQIWRFGGVQSYIRLLMSDAFAFIAVEILNLAINSFRFKIITAICLISLDLLFALAARMYYRYAYKCGNRPGILGKVLRFSLILLGGAHVEQDVKEDVESADRSRIKIAIIGAGRTGVTICEELINNSRSGYEPILFIDINPQKAGRKIYGIPVVSQEKATVEYIKSIGVQELVLAVPQLGVEEKKATFSYYKEAGLRMRTYDFPKLDGTDNSTGKRKMRDFDIEDLLFRKEIDFRDEKTNAYYAGKRVLITGGGGSIGSELCRQIARMHPEKLIILDVYENGAYDIQQELKIQYGNSIDISVEILSVCNLPALERVFEFYKPEIVLNAAAHKHVPLMEHNVCEAVENNVFGTLNTVKCAEKYGAKRFIMVSTDKAVNPTNVMGATKRMCEMIVQSHAASGSGTKYSATRFGNVLGSAGSVIPLFRRQIAKGGPVTITDKRIIRYFMTIPEASRLVLQSGAMAQNGELFVLDMGQPVRILDLAENMIRLSGHEPYTDIQIEFTGLRPGEKLYEELLVTGENLGRTENSLIFVEKDEALSLKEIDAKLDMLRKAVATGSDSKVKEALRNAVPTFRTPEEVNAEAEKSAEMNNVRSI